MRVFIFVFVSLCGPLFSACTPKAVEAPPAPAPVVVAPKPPIELKADWGSKPEWSAFTLAAIAEHGSALLNKNPGDWAKFCARPFAQLSSDEKAAFYLGLISALARFESSFKPDVTYTEAFPDAQGRKVISRGLLQLSQESANGYKCGITDAKQLHDPRTNLSCGVRILSRWVERDGVIQGGGTGGWKGAARYWSPFRKADRIAKMAAFTKSLKVCQ